MHLAERLKEVFPCEIVVGGVFVEMVDFRKIGIFGDFKVGKITPSEIILFGKACEVSLLGEDLFVAEAGEGEIFVCGKISRLEKK